ncbi:MAG: TrmB family transcriptional regulator [Minisyncoccota bacterium]
MTPLIKKLSALGLPEKDAQVYLALLSLDGATAQLASKETDINRSSMYVVLERLVKRGLVSIATTHGIRKYVAAPPERLLQLAKEQAEKHEMLSKSLRTMLPTLSSKHRGAHYRPKVTVLEGRQGLVDGFEDSLSLKKGPMRVISSGPEIFRTLPEYLSTYVQKRMEKGVGMVGIHPAEPHSMKAFKSMPVSKSLDKHLFIPEDKYRFPADFGIYDDKTVFMSHTFLFTAFIESQQIAELMRTIFDLAVGEAQRIGEEFP